jgi:tetratricopeptide (TPR) repeat protein
MDLEQAILNCLRGDGILFTGAGFSFGAQNGNPQLGNTVPDARAFSAHLSKVLNVDQVYDLPIITQHFISKRAEYALLNEITSAFTTTEVQQYHIDIAKIPWRRVYTTNYDNVFELAALQSDLKYSSVTLNTKPSAAKSLCVHINGHINNLSLENLSSQIKLTHSSYSSEDFAKSFWAQQLRQDMANAKSIVFIGYSMADMDIARILFTSPELKQRTFFIVAPNADEITTSLLHEYGTVEPIGVEQFSRIAAEIEVPKKIDIDYNYSWLNEYKDVEQPEKPSIEECIDLLMLGVIEQRNVVWSLGESDTNGYIRREEISDIMRELKNGRSWFLLHSHLGNGKTVLKHQLSHILSKDGYTVYWDSDFELNRTSDLFELSKTKNKVALFIDESSDRFNVIDGLLGLNNSNIKIFISVRTTLFELGESRYDEFLPVDYIPIDLNKLQKENIHNFMLVLNKNGLWGDRASLSPEEKESFLITNCGGSISRAILAIFESSEIGRRIALIANDAISNDEQVKDVVILILLLNYLNNPPSISLLSEILGFDVYFLVKSERFQKASEFIRLRNGKVKARSSILAQFVLNKCVKSEVLIEIFERTVRNLASKRRDGAMYTVFIELQRFARLEQTLSASNKLDLMYAYYQSLAELKVMDRSALFWLQFAMCTLSQGKFKESDRMFKQAKSLAKNNEKETTDVNNHYARLLLDSRTESSEYEDYFDAFHTAHRILLDQINKNTNKHFPFRQAIKYVDFISHRKSELTSGEISRFTNSCKQILNSIQNLDGSILQKNDVKKCENAMNRAIEIASKS